MQLREISKNLYDVDAWLDDECGKIGTPEREAFREEAYSYCVGTIIHDARKREKMTQQQLAEKVGSTKSYISRIEKGLIEPGAGFFLRIMSALNLQMQFVTKDGLIPV